MKAKLLEAGISPLELIVFGSRARGDHEPYSDMDILVILEDLPPEVDSKIADLAWEVGFDHNLVICPIVWSREQLESVPCQELPLLDAVREQGIAV